MKSRHALIFVLLSAGALAGCAPAASAAVRSTAVPVAPSPVLGANCGALFSDAYVSELLGTPVTAQELFLDSPIQQAVPTLNGLSCEWSPIPRADGSGSGASVTAVVLNSALAPPGSTDDSCAGGAATATSVDAIGCRFGVIVGDLWLSGVAYAPAGTAEDDVRSVVADLSDAFGAFPVGYTPARPALPVSAWAAPDCAELSRTAGVAATLESPGLVGNEVAVAGDDSARGNSAAQVRAGVFACAWYHPGPTPDGQFGGFSIQGLPGGAWAQSQVLAIPGASVVDIAGVELAVRVPTAFGHETLDVFDGVNWLQVAAAGTLDPVLPALPALLDALAGDPVPTRQ
jgi:hypothetical protein